MKLVRRTDEGIEFERVVMCELLIPDVPNAMGDIMTREAIRDAAYEFARQGFGIDVEHDQSDVTGDVVLVESFIARDSDPDFIPGSWVLGMKIYSDDIWQQVLDGELNGFSYEALAYMQEVVFQNLRERQIVGTTEPHPIDGHTHDYVVILNALNRPTAGNTGITNGHSHRIATHTLTEEADGHTHRYQVIKEG